MSERAAWLVVGAEVATLRDDWHRYGSRPILATVARIGKRDVVLDDEQRFNVSRLERKNGGPWDGVTKLLPADAAEVVLALAPLTDIEDEIRALFEKGDDRA